MRLNDARVSVMQCYGRNTAVNCCYVNGSPCKFLEENSEVGQRWSCQLHREGGSWAAAIADPRYFEGEDAPGDAFKDTPYKNCEDFQCKECGQFERGEITREELDAIKSDETIRERVRNADRVS